MKKEFYLPLIIIVLTITFVIVCFLVYITNGKAKFIYWKMKTGALLLTLNALSTGAVAQYDGEVSCYLMPGEVTKHLYIGPDVSFNREFNYNPPLAQSSYSPIITDKSYNADGFSVGINNEYFFGYSTPHSILIKLKYSSFRLKLDEVITDKYYYSVLLTGDLSKDGILFYKPEIKMSSLGLELIWRYNFWNNIVFGIGPQFEMILKNDMTERIEISQTAIGLTNFRDDDPYMKFENNRRTLILYKGEPYDNNKFNFKIKGEISYEIITPGFDIIPYLGYSYSIISLNSHSGWKNNSLNVGIYLRIPILL
jgi:hypothetical protein